MRIKAFGLFFPVVAACVIEPHYEDRVLPARDDVAILRSARYVSHTSSDLVLDVNIGVLSSFYEGFDNDYLDAGNFDVIGSEGDYSIESFDSYAIEKSPQVSAIVLLIDQSGSYTIVDPYNTRSQAINKFLRDIVPPHTFMVGASSRGGALEKEPLEMFSSGLLNDVHDTFDYLFELGRRTGGERAVLDAADQAIGMLAQNTGVERKELVLLVHGSDVNSVSSYNDIIAKAQINAVSIHVIALGTGPEVNEWLKVSRETGGLYAACINDRQMIKVFDELFRLLQGSVFEYRLRIRFQPTQPQVEPGTVWIMQVEIKDIYSDRDYNRVPVEIIVPS